MDKRGLGGIDYLYGVPYEFVELTQSYRAELIPGLHRGGGNKEVQGRLEQPALYSSPRRPLLAMAIEERSQLPIDLRARLARASNRTTAATEAIARRQALFRWWRARLCCCLRY